MTNDDLKKIAAIRSDLEEMVQRDQDFVYAIVLLKPTSGEVISNVCCLDHLIDAIDQINNSSTREQMQ